MRLASNPGTTSAWDCRERDPATRSIPALSHYRDQGGTVSDFKLDTDYSSDAEEVIRTLSGLTVKYVMASDEKKHNCNSY